MSQPDRTHITETFNKLKVKKIKKDDRIQIGFRSLVVVENKKNSLGNRVLNLRSVGPLSVDHLTLIVPKDFEIRTTRSKTVNHKK